MFFIQALSAYAEPAKVMSIHYDDSSSLIFINVQGTDNSSPGELKISRLENPNRIYFDIKDSILIGDKQQLSFDKSAIKEI